MGRVRGPVPSLKRVDISHLSPAQRAQYVDALQYFMIGVKEFDRFWKRVSNTMRAIESGRTWLTTTQWSTAQFALEKFIKEMKNSGLSLRQGGKK